MMKKVIPILLTLLIFLTSTCFAAYEPDPARWVWLGSDDEVGMFLDKETIEYSADGNTVDFWICYVVPQKNEHAILNQKLNKNTRILTITHITIYDSTSKKSILSYTYKPWEQESQKIIPDTNGEILYRYFFPK